MSENNIEKLFVESCIVSKIPTYLDIVKNSNMSKEDWEKYKQSILKEIEEADKYFEEKKPILTDEEREYLSVVIKPFRKEIKYIVKLEDCLSYEFIKIRLKNSDAMFFPNFPSDTKYKGMEINIPYTLEELGL